MTFRLWLCFIYISDEPIWGFVRYRSLLRINIGYNIVRMDMYIHIDTMYLGKYVFHAKQL